MRGHFEEGYQHFAVPLLRLCSWYAISSILAIYLLPVVKVCVHTLLVILYLENVFPALFKATSANSKTHAQKQDLSDDEDSDTDSVEEESSKYMAQYIFKNHRLPEDSLSIRQPHEKKVWKCVEECPSRGNTGKGQAACEHTFPSEFRPDSNLKCARCPVAPLVFRVAQRDAVLYTLTRAIDGITVWEAHCPSCRATYLPHPLEDGIFCHSSKRLYALPLLWHLRDNVDNGLAPQSAIAAWLANPQFALTRMQRRDRHHFHAFISHLVLTDFTYDFLAGLGAPDLSKQVFPMFCLLCGFWPLFVYFDGNKKSTTSLKGISFEDKSAQTVNVKDFWDTTCVQLLQARDNKSLPILNANSIAPFMGASVRRSEVFVNPSAESKSFTFDDPQEFVDRCNDFEEQFGAESKYPMSDDQFHNLCKVGKDKIVDILVKCGMGKARVAAFDTAALIELIASLRGGSKGCFAKLFAKHLGRSGGTVDCVCPHLIQYAFKPIPRAESPRDPASLLTWFNHLPHCACYDFWCGGANMLSDECKKVAIQLGPRQGAVVAEDELEEHAHLLPVSIPAMDMECAPSFRFSDKDRKNDGEDSLNLDVNRPAHPVTGSKVFIAAHDSFHGAAHERCRARDTDLVVQFRSVDTSRQEHLNRMRQSHDHFLRNQAVQRNIFLHLVLAHRRNRARNQEMLSAVEKQVRDLRRDAPAFTWQLELNKATGRLEIKGSRVRRS